MGSCGSYFSLQMCSWVDMFDTCIIAELTIWPFRSCWSEEPKNWKALSILRGVLVISGNLRVKWAQWSPASFIEIVSPTPATPAGSCSMTMHFCRLQQEEPNLQLLCSGWALYSSERTSPPAVVYSHWCGRSHPLPTLPQSLHSHGSGYLCDCPGIGSETPWVPKDVDSRVLAIAWCKACV